MNAPDNATRLLIQVQGSELKTLFLEAAQVHESKAKYYRIEAENSKKLMEEQTDRHRSKFEVTEQVFLSTSYAPPISIQKSFTDKAIEHENSARQKKFIGEHLKDMVYELVPDVLRTWGLI